MAAAATHRPCPCSPPMPSSSAAGTTGWSPPRCSPTPAGTSACSRRRTGSAARSARRRCTRASPRTCSRRSTRSTRRRRSCRRWTSRRTGCAGRMRRSVLAHPPRPDGRTSRGAVARPGGDRRPPGRGPPARRRRVAGAVPAVGRRPATPLLRTLFTTFPPVRGPVRAAAARSARPRRCDWPGSCCCRRSGWARSCSRAKALGCCSPVTPRTPTRRSTRRSAARTAGCWPCSGSTTGSRCRSAARASWPPRSRDGREAAGAALCTRAAGASGSTYARPGRRRAHRGGLTVRVRRAVIADVNAPTLYREAAARRRRTGPAARRPGPVRLGHPGRQGQLGARRADPVARAGGRPGGHRAPGRGRARAGPVVGGPGVAHASAVAVHAVRADDDRRRRAAPPRAPRARGRTRTCRAGSTTTRRPTSWPAASTRPSRRSPRASTRVSLHRHVQRPSDISRTPTRTWSSGAVNGGTAQLFQQLVFRPVPGLGRPETVIGNLFLGSSSAHPGGGVHGVCGALAARAALRDHGLRGLVRRRADLRRSRTCSTVLDFASAHRLASKGRLARTNVATRAPLRSDSRAES